MTGGGALALELVGVSKRFGAVAAASEVDLRVERGTVHALVGENGAGKSTLMRIAYGLVRADAGRISLAGEPVDRSSHDPAESIRRRVGMVHQHFMLVDTLSVIENVVLGREPGRGGWLDLADAAEQLRQLGARHGLKVDPWARAGELSVGEQQRVEILKVLWQGCDVLILDEPTAVLSPLEVRELFALLRTLVEGGAAVVLITHKLDEVVAVADCCTVMRKGRRVAELRPPLDADAIAQAMVGRAARGAAAAAATTPAAAGPPSLRIASLEVAGRGGTPAVRGVSLTVAAGEVVGVAGVEGNGQAELVEALVGLRPVTAGAIELDGARIERASVAARQRAGLAVIHEDRRRRGLVLPMSVAENAVLGRQRELARPWRLDAAALARAAEPLIAAYDVRPPSAAAVVDALSGGNQQKLVVGRELGRPSLRVLICAQPTRGVDIGAIELIHARLTEARNAGVAVLLISAELEELRALSDRVVVLYRGAIVHETIAGALATDAGLETLGAFMTGARGDA